MPDLNLKSRSIFLGVILFSLFFFSSSAYAGNPTTPILPSDNIQDPGDPGTSWGGCGPTDSNCYVTTSNLLVEMGVNSYSIDASIQNVFNSFFVGDNTGLNATNANESNFLGASAGGSATNANQSNFFGSNAGNGATNANNSNFIGHNSGDTAVNASYSNFLGDSAGKYATDSSFSNFFGSSAGNLANNASESNFLGHAAGLAAGNASYSNFLGYFAGYFASNASYSNLFGYNAGRNFTGNNIGSNNIIIGTNLSLPNGATNSINIGGVLFGTGTYSTTTGDPSITPVSGGRIGIGTITPASKFDITTNSLGTTQTDTSGILLANTTAAANGAQQISPAIRWRGNGWKTNATAASQTVDFRSYVYTYQGTSAPNGMWFLDASVNGGAYTQRFGVGLSGDLYLSSGGSGTSGQVLTSQGAGASAYWSTLPTPFSLTNGSGTTANGTAVDLGGTATGNISVNGNNNSIEFYANNNGFIRTSSGGVVSLGDVDNNSNNTRLVVDDGSKTISIQANASGFSADNASATTVIGDWVTNGNSTKIVVNDSASNITLHNSVQFDSYGAGTLVTDGSGNITASSDERLKNIQGQYTAGLNELMNINPIMYKWNELSKLDMKDIYAGFSAQNVQANIPYGTGIDKKGYLTLQDRAILAATVNAIKELNLKVSGINNVIPDINSDTTFADKFIVWLANAGNRITRIFTGELCLTDPDGTSECINKSQLGQLKQLINSQTSPSVPEQNNSQPSLDICPNIDGVQITVPDGLHLDESNNCIESQTTETIPTEPQNSNQENNNSVIE